jgi:flagellar biosynthetic protein FliQ
MSQSDVLTVSREVILITLELSLPILLFGLVAGVMVSIFQAVTSIQEFTLTFVPKLLAVVLALMIFGSWMLTTLVNFMVTTYQHMPPITH